LVLTQRVTELYNYRELIRNLVVRDLKVRYKNSVLGFLWSLVNPLLMMLVFTVVFQVMLPNYPIHAYPIFILCALLPWNWFAASLNEAIPSIVNNAHLIKKVYFPREVLPLSVVLANGVNFLLALLVLFALIPFFGIRPSVWVFLLPLIILIQLVFTVGLALILATVNVFYRDTGVIMEVVLLAWFFLTPIFYPITLLSQYREILGIMVPVQRLVYILNPMASLISAYRVILWGSPLEGGPPGPPAFDFLARTAVTALLMLIIGYLVFARYSPRFGEEV
jgi:ABC-type polysaccharide/polyol phosphate export permease